MVGGVCWEGQANGFPSFNAKLNYPAAGCGFILNEQIFYISSLTLRKKVNKHISPNYSFECLENKVISFVFSHSLLTKKYKPLTMWPTDKTQKGTQKALTFRLQATVPVV